VTTKYEPIAVGDTLYYRHGIGRNGLPEVWFETKVTRVTKTTLAIEDGKTYTIRRAGYTDNARAASFRERGNSYFGGWAHRAKPKGDIVLTTRAEHMAALDAEHAAKIRDEETLRLAYIAEHDGDVFALKAKFVEILSEAKGIGLSSDHELSKWRKAVDDDEKFISAMLYAAVDVADNNRRSREKLEQVSKGITRFLDGDGF
jgi:hypothetical protein